MVIRKLLQAHHHSWWNSQGTGAMGLSEHCSHSQENICVWNKLWLESFLSFTLHVCFIPPHVKRTREIKSNCQEMYKLGSTEKIHRKHVSVSTSKKCGFKDILVSVSKVIPNLRWVFPWGFLYWAQVARAPSPSAVLRQTHTVLRPSSGTLVIRGDEDHWFGRSTLPGS